MLGVAVDKAVTLGISKRADTQICLFSPFAKTVYQTSLEALDPTAGPLWTRYLLGVLHALKRRGLQLTAGFNCLNISTIPAGAGMSSSAAIELAMVWALSDLYCFPMDRLEAARIGREAENQTVGMPCGLLDQGVSSMGARHHLVGIDCATETFSTVPLPVGLRFHVFNSSQAHALVDSLFAERHRECQQALAAITTRWPQVAHLAEATQRQLQISALPAPLKQRAQHVVEEQARVHAALEALEAGDSRAFGQQLSASHESSRTLFENSAPELDSLGAELTQRGGVLGARLTGGGFGGAVMALTQPSFTDQSAHEVCVAYEARFGSLPMHFECQSSDGARVLISSQASANKL